MKRSHACVLAALLCSLPACQVHHPQLGPNVELLDEERRQLDEFVAIQQPLPANDDPAVREACTREVEATAAKEPGGGWTSAAMDTAVRECVEKRNQD